MNRHLIFNTAIVLLAAVSFASCNTRRGPETQEYNFDSGITPATLEVKDFISGGTSKSYITVDDDVYSFNWDKGDRVAFFPASSEDVPDQATFVIANVGATSTDAHLRSEGWSLIRGRRYFSYYPYTSSAVFHNVDVSFTGQRQAADNRTNHLGNFDYMYSYMDTPLEGEGTMSFDHLCCIVHFKLQIPAAVRNTSRFNAMTLTSDDNVFVTAACFDPIYDPDNAVYPTLTPTVSSDDFNMGIGYGSGVFCGNDGYLDVYAMMCPNAAWSNKTLTVFLSDTDGNRFRGTINTLSTVQQKGHVYDYLAEMEADGTVIINLSSYQPANCYIISRAGKFKFTPTIGNTSTEIVPHHVGVLWETDNTITAPGVGSIISTASYNSEYGYVYLETPATFKEGNALIAAYDSSNNIIWSWHIWCTDLPADQQYKYDAGYLQDRNLGALAASDAERNLTTGLLYQFGRKDPFPAYANTSSNTKMVVSGTAMTTTPATAANGTIAYSVEHPTVFITGPGVRNGDWIYANPQVDWSVITPVDEEQALWYGGTGIKTKYDPCPPGYRVPDGGTVISTKGFFGKALGISGQIGGTLTGSTVTFSAAPAGTFTLVYNQRMTFPLTSGYAYYPTVSIYNEDGSSTSSAYLGKNINLWGNYPAGTDGSVWQKKYSGNLDINGVVKAVNADFNSGRAAGKSVRCMRMPVDVEEQLMSSTDNEIITNISSGW